MRKALTALILLASCLAAALPARAGKAVFPENTALFERPDFGSRYLGCFSGEAETVAEPVTGYSANHPLAVGCRYVRVTLPDGRAGYASERIVGASAESLQKLPEFPSAYCFPAV